MSTRISVFLTIILFIFAVALYWYYNETGTAAALFACGFVCAVIVNNIIDLAWGAGSRHA